MPISICSIPNYSLYIDPERVKDYNLGRRLKLLASQRSSKLKVCQILFTYTEISFDPVRIPEYNKGHRPLLNTSNAYKQAVSLP